MHRSQTLPDTFRPEDFHRRALLQTEDFGPPFDSDDANGNSRQQHETDVIVRNIASFLTISDAASLMSTGAGCSDDHKSGMDEDEDEILAMQRSDSWAIGVDMAGMTSSSPVPRQPMGPAPVSPWEQGLTEDSPPSQRTPPFISISPGATPRFDFAEDHLHDDDYECLEHTDHGYEEMEEILRERRKRWVQQRLAAAVYSHPGSVRSFCLEAYQSARDILMERKLHQPLYRHPEEDEEEDPETCVEPPNCERRPQNIHRRSQHYPITKRSSKRRRLVSVITDAILNNVPMSVLIDVLEAVGEVSLDATFASFTLAGRSLDALLNGVLRMLGAVWHGIANFNPFQLLEAIVSFQFNAMGKTSEALASGIQSVATGVGSASSLALHRLSAANLSVATRAMSGGVVGGSDAALSALHKADMSGLRRSRSTGTVLNKKLLRKLSAMNDAAKVVQYMESEDETGGLTKQARSRVQRMMHYDVSLRPFFATVQCKRKDIRQEVSSLDQRSAQFLPHAPFDRHPSSFGSTESSDTQSPCLDDSSSSPLMYTPQSFPPTPHSRQIVMARGGRFADDVVFLARDRLWLHDSLESENERTREMAKLLKEKKRLAVFNARDAPGGIELTCGQHIATKAGNMLYCTTRGMVPVLRNCLVYFEMTVLPRSFGNLALQPSMTTLSIGLSTEEMPANALVGAWQGSCGLCTTGQIFAGGVWCAPSDPAVAAYRDGATIGCLVYLDDASAVDTWEGILVNTAVTFNVNGFLVAPIVDSSSEVRAVAAASPPGMPLEPEGAGERVCGCANETDAENGVAARSPSSCSPWREGEDHPPITLSIKVPGAEELYPTVTLHSPATSVMCRFSAEDIVASSRETIGAPPASTVYAVDGSVIFV